MSSNPIIRKQTAIWTTRDGTRIRICDMTDTHLANTIAWMERVAEQQARVFATAPNPFQGDIAFDLFEAAQDAILSGETEADPSELFPIYEKLCAERERRQRASRP